MHQILDFPPAPLRRSSLMWLWLPLALIIGMLITVAMAPPQTSRSGLFVTVPFVLLLGLVLNWMLRRRSIRLDNRQLQITATLYKRTLAVEQIDLRRARVLSLDEHTELRPRLKTNGFSLPGFYAGHFRLCNLTKAFCLITDRTRVLSLPLRDGGLVLLSPEKPRVLLDRLRQLADARGHR
ncbi:PH domain-containing protein [Pseudoxanthomonas wuyuanensis]